MRVLAGVWAALWMATVAGAQADPGELASIRSELTQLNGEIQALRVELTQQAATNTQPAANVGPATLRLDRLEEELRLVTGRVEQLSFRIEQIVADGTRRIGDLEFRLVELEGGDVSTLGTTSTLGGDVTTAVAPTITQAQPTVALAVTEQSDFDAALTALKEQDQVTAIQMFGKFLADYPGGPLSAQAMFHLGEAQSGLGRPKDAARSFLDSFTVQPNGPFAARALTRVGLTLGELGQVGEACRTLNEVLLRYPSDAAQAQAQTGMQSLGCS